MSSSKVDVSLRCNLGNILIKPLSRDDWLRKEKNKIGHNIDLAVIALTSSGFHLSREIKFETLIPSNKSRKDLWPIKYESANFFQRGKVSKVESHDQKYRRPVLQTRDDFSHIFRGASLGQSRLFHRRRPPISPPSQRLARTLFTKLSCLANETRLRSAPSQVQTHALLISRRAPYRYQRFSEGL